MGTPFGSLGVRCRSLPARNPSYPSRFREQERTTAKRRHNVIRYSSLLMGRGSRAVKRWRNDRQRKKKAREKKKAQEAKAK